jgi:hypothetical protein
LTKSSINPPEKLIFSTIRGKSPTQGFSVDSGIVLAKYAVCRDDSASNGNF